MRVIISNFIYKCECLNEIGIKPQICVSGPFDLKEANGISVGASTNCKLSVSRQLLDCPFWHLLIDSLPCCLCGSCTEGKMTWTKILQASFEHTAFHFAKELFRFLKER